MQKLSDHDLMMAVKNGDLDKMGLIFNRHHKKLYNILLWQTHDPGLSEDLVQEVFYRMLKSRHTYKGMGKFSAWMNVIARSVKIDHYRKAKPLSTLESLRNQKEENPLPDELLETKDEAEILHQAISRLDKKKREVLIMSRFQNMKYEKIAKILGCSVGTVKARVFWALRDLLVIYQKMTGEVLT